MVAKEVYFDVKTTNIYIYDYFYGFLLLGKCNIYRPLIHQKRLKNVKS